MAGVAPKPKTNKKSAILGAAFLGAVLVANIVYLYATHQIDEFSRALSQVSGIWLFAIALLMVGNLGFGALAYLITAWLDPTAPMGARDSVAVEAAGTFFGNLTPLSVGGLPGQIWRLCKAGYTPGEATAVQLARFSLYQVAQTIEAAVLLIAFWSVIQTSYGTVIWVAFALVGFKVIQTALIVLACLFPGFLARVGDALINFLEAWGFSKRLVGAPRLEKWRAALHEETATFGTVFRQLAAAWRQMLFVLVVSIVQLTCLFSTDWFALRAFGVDLGFWETLALGTLVQLVATVIPTPGGTGGIEAAFLYFFSGHLGRAAVACFLVWRVVTFYVYTGVCGVCTFLRSKPGSRKPYEALQRLIGKDDVNFGGVKEKADVATHPDQTTRRPR